MTNQFQTKKDAVEFLASIKWLDSHSDGKKFSSNKEYWCSHGEHSRPDYYPCRYKDGWAIKADYFYYGGTFYAPKSGRLDDDTFNDLFLIN